MQTFYILFFKRRGAHSNVFRNRVISRKTIQKGKGKVDGTRKFPREEMKIHSSLIGLMWW